MGKKSAPKPPNPYKVAAAQGAADRGTAEYNRLINQVGQEGPDGSLEYVQDGFDSYTDPISKQTIKVPRYKAVTKLSAAQQGIKDATDATKANSARIAQALSSRLSDTPLDLSSENVRKYIDTHFLDEFDADWKRQAADRDARLAERGIALGSDAYTRSVDDFSASRSRARGNLYGDRYDAAVNAIRAQDSYPLEKIASLLGMSSASSPNGAFVPVAQTSTQSPPIADLISSNYQAQLAASQQKQSGFDKMLGGLFGVGAAAVPLLFSDRRLKTDVKKVGKTDDGQNVYAYRYKGDRRMHLGLMAQEVEKKTPEAVVNVGGYKAVDYGKALHLGAA